MKLKWHLLLVAPALLAWTSAAAYESDVHFGLTKWLATQAGFDAQEADAIALGDQRVDSGDMQYVAMVFDYACLAADAELSREVALHHFPTPTPPPAVAEQRRVTAASEEAWSAALEMSQVQSSQAGFLLFKLGEALHILQDSFAHQGTPDTPDAGPDFRCDPELAWGHPRERGGASSHRADLTRYWPDETVAMAKATYDALTRFPAIGSVSRTPRRWDELRPQLDGFAKAASKSEKQAWFAAHGFADVSFLAGTSLPDGPKPLALSWQGRRLPKLPTLQSRQHRVDPNLLDFFNAFFEKWLSTDDFQALAIAYSAPAQRATDAARSPARVDQAQLAARLTVWRVRDHGAVAALAHATAPLNARQLAALRALAGTPKALVTYAAPTEAIFPLVTNGKDASPLLPFIVRDAPPAPNGNRRAAAIVKFRHAPYDCVATIAEQVEGRWRLVSIVSTVDH